MTPSEFAKRVNFETNLNLHPDDISLIRSFLGMQNSEYTASTYFYGIHRFLSWVVPTRAGARYRLHSTSYLDVVGWKADMEKAELNPTSQSVYWDGVNSLFSFLISRNILRNHPFKGAKKPKRITDQRRPMPSVSDVTAMMFYMMVDSANPNRLRDAAIMRVITHGLRVSEVVALDIGDIVALDDSEKDLASFPRHGINVMGKGKKHRTVPIGENSATLINEYIDTRESGPLFINSTGQRITVRTVQRVIEHGLKLSGLTGMGYGPHSFRHNYATRLLRSDVPIHIVSKLLGHSDVKTTMVYLHLDVSDTLVALEKDPLT